jgi:hypothetical protein
MVGVMQWNGYHDENAPKKRTKRFLATEYEECKLYYDWTQTMPALKDNVAKITNEGKRSLRIGHLLVSIGLRKGFPDYFIHVRNERYGGLFIEMKRRFNFTHDAHQDAYIARLLEQGYYACYAKGADAAIKITLDYLADSL